MLKKIPLQALLSIAVIIGCLLLAYIMIASRSPVQYVEKKPVPTLIETLFVEPRDEKVTVSAYGTVQPNRDTKVFSQVSGRIVEQSPDLVIGGLVDKGQMLVKIDPKDYEIAIASTRAAVEKAEFELKVEEGRQIVAKREWLLLDPSIQSTEVGSSLALREPHLKEKKAALSGVKSQLAKAILDLNRTEIRAPFSAVVLEEAVEPQDLINPQTQIAKLVATDAFRVKVSIPFRDLQWIPIPRNGDIGVKATITQELGAGKQLKREGVVVRLLGDLDPQGRMVRLLVLIHDPFGLSNHALASKPLLLGSYVRVDIHGPLLRDAYAIPREAIRQGDQVWVMSDEDTLEIRTVEISLKREDDVLVTGGLEPGDLVIISNLHTPIPGMALQELE